MDIVLTLWSPGSPMSRLAEPPERAWLGWVGGCLRCGHLMCCLGVCLKTEWWDHVPHHKLSQLVSGLLEVSICNQRAVSLNWDFAVT